MESIGAQAVLFGILQHISIHSQQVYSGIGRVGIFPGYDFIVKRLAVFETCRYMRFSASTLNISGNAGIGDATENNFLFGDGNDSPTAVTLEKFSAAVQPPVSPLMVLAIICGLSLAGLGVAWSNRFIFPRPGGIRF